MERFQRISWALLLVTAACGDDVSGGGEGSTGADESSSGDTVDPTNATTSATTTGETDATSTTDDTDGTTGSTTTVDPDTGSSADDGTTTGTTSGDDSSSSSGEESSSSTGDPPLDCGNDVIDDGEDCDGAALGEATCLSIGLGFTGGALACGDDCSFDTSGCVAGNLPEAGEILISEIMPNPTVVADEVGEWFELHNPGGESFDLGGCEISGGEGEDVILLDEMTMGPGAYLTFAPSSMEDAGFLPDVEWDVDYFIGNGGDVITLSCGGGTIDTVDYDLFPPGSGVSLNLDPDDYDAAANDVASSWCEGTMEYNAAGDDVDRGTPGAANDGCPEPLIYTVDFCRLQFPSSIDEPTGTGVSVFGRLYIEGLTDMTDGNDLVPEVSGQVGYGPDGTDPALDAGWVWTDAADNPGWDGSETNNDEYLATLSVPAPGEYDFAYRFSGDSGASYTYCDGMDAGSSDGYQVGNAGQMTATEATFDLQLAEVYYDNPGGDGMLEWVKLYNAGDEAIDLAAYSLGHGGTDYTYGTYQLAGVVEPGECFVVGGPDASPDNGFGDTPAYDQATAFVPNIQNAGTTADGVALFNVTADTVASDTTPIDAVLFGESNGNALLDESGAAGAVDVADAPSGDSLVRQSDGTWAILAEPTPTTCVLPDPA